VAKCWSKPGNRRGWRGWRGWEKVGEDGDGRGRVGNVCKVVVLGEWGRSLGNNV